MPKESQSHSARTAIIVEVVVAVDMEMPIVVVKRSRPRIASPFCVSTVASSFRICYQVLQLNFITKLVLMGRRVALTLARTMKL